MNKKNDRGNVLLFVILVVVIFAIGLIIYQMVGKNNTAFPSSSNTTDTSMKNETDMSGKVTNDSKSDDSMIGGKYVVYSPQSFNENQDKKRVLFFYANWCPICQPADAEFKANLDRIPEDVVVIRVNYNDSDTDRNEEVLADEYGITYQHTFVQIDNSGNEVAKWNGGALNDLLSNIK